MVSDMMIFPVSISYERTLEEDLFARELMGVPKPKETLSVSTCTCKFMAFTIYQTTNKQTNKQTSKQTDKLACHITQPSIKKINLIINMASNSQNC